VILDVATRPRGIEVVFLDTQYHLAEALWYVERVKERYDLTRPSMEPLGPRRPVADRHRRMLRECGSEPLAGQRASRRG